MRRCIYSNNLWQSNLFGAIGGNFDLKVCCTRLARLPSLIQWPRAGQAHLFFPFADAPELPDLSSLWNAVNFVVNELMEERRVLVFCNQGENRSMLFCGCVRWKLTNERNIGDIMRALNPGCLYNELFYRYLQITSS
jgi:hypothetical protein